MKTVGQYLIDTLIRHGVKVVFGVPGDYIIDWYTELCDAAGIEVVTCSSELWAGVAADAYARANGMGAVVTTFNVGGLRVAEPLAGARAEYSPVISICGSPGMELRHRGLLHHCTHDLQMQLANMQRICASAMALDVSTLAFQQIDRVFAAVSETSCPGYIELPADMVGVAPDVEHQPQVAVSGSDSRNLEQAVAAAAELLRGASNPAILAGVLVHRLGVHELLIQLAEKLGIPVFETMLGKSSVDEGHGLYGGLYAGAAGDEEAAKYVDSSDLVLVVGALWNDVNLGAYTAQLESSRCVSVSSTRVDVKGKGYHAVRLVDFLTALTSQQFDKRTWQAPAVLPEARGQFVPNDDTPITIGRLIELLDTLLDDETAVVADVGDALFASSRLHLRRQAEYFAPAHWLALGWGIPGTLGILSARPREHRVVALVGDGGFQMSFNELSTIIHRGYAPIIIVLDNGGYGTERVIHDPNAAFNNIPAWDYGMVTQLFGGGRSIKVGTEKELVDALGREWSQRDQLTLLHVKLPRDDASPTLQRLCARLKQQRHEG